MIGENQWIEVHLAGADLLPSKINARDVGKLITAVEAMIAPLVVRENPALGLSEKEVIVGLAGVREGSYVLEFATPYEQPVMRAFQDIATALNEQIFISLPQETVDALVEIRSVTRLYKTAAELWLQNGQLAKIAEINQHTEISYEPEAMQGTTTLYGTVIRVGGEKPPRAKIRFLNGIELTCNITQRDSLSVARALGQRLYDTVGLYGRARWTTPDMRLHDFVIESVLPYRKKPILDNLMALRELVGPYLEEVENIDAYIHNLRGQTDDDH